MRVLFTATPGRGHLHPMVPLAAAFGERGHEVAWVVAEEACPRLRSEGFEAFAGGLAEQAALAEVMRRFPEVHDLPPPERPAFLFPRLFGLVRTGPMLADLLPIARTWKPSLIVSDQAELAAPIVAASLGVPSVTHSFGHLLPATRLAAAGEVVAPLWEEHGLEPRPFAGCYDHLYVDIYPPSLQTSDTGHVGALTTVRPVSFAAAGEEGAPPWLADDRAGPLVYVTFGTVFNRDLDVVSRVVEALRPLPVRIVVTLGPGHTRDTLGEQPPNVHVAGYIAQTELLPHCSAVVSHAGSGTFLAALARGLPQVFLPQAADQFLNAAAGARAGAGIAVPPAELTVERVGEEFVRLLADDAFRRAAGRLAAEIRAMPPPGAVVEEIEHRFGR